MYRIFFPGDFFMYEMTDSASENSGHFAGVIGPERNFDIINKKINIGQRAAQ